MSKHQRDNRALEDAYKLVCEGVISLEEGIWDRTKAKVAGAVQGASNVISGNSQPQFSASDNKANAINNSFYKRFDKEMNNFNNRLIKTLGAADINDVRKQLDAISPESGEFFDRMRGLHTTIEKTIQSYQSKQPHQAQPEATPQPAQPQPAQPQQAQPQQAQPQQAQPQQAQPPAQAPAQAPAQPAQPPLTPTTQRTIPVQPAKPKPPRNPANQRTMSA